MVSERGSPLSPCPSLKHNPRNWKTSWHYMLSEVQFHTKASKILFVYSSFIILSVACNILRSVDMSDEPWATVHTVLTSIDFYSHIFYGSEIIFRYWICPSKSDYFRDPYSYLDLLCFVPFFISACIPDEKERYNKFLLAVIPPARLLKITRTSPAWMIIVLTCKRAKSALKVPLFFLIVLTLIFSCALFYVEPDNFQDIPQAIWFAFVTICTVGYGDFTPKTTIGRIITVFLILFAAIYLAMPLNLVGGFFASIYADKERLITIEKIKSRVTDYDSIEQKELKDLFNFCDRDLSGFIDFEEFKHLLNQELMLELTNLEIKSFFKAIDNKNQGKIGFEQFVAYFFPHADVMKQTKDDTRSSHNEAVSVGSSMFANDRTPIETHLRNIELQIAELRRQLLISR
jgi:voltage-gated potassium channel